MSQPQEIREQAIGPFEYDEAEKLIGKFALALTNLGINDRFTVQATPRRVVEYEKRSDGRPGRRQVCYQVVLLDKRPHEPPPKGLSALGIRKAEAQGYRTRVDKKAS